MGEVAFLRSTVAEPAFPSRALVATLSAVTARLEDGGRTLTGGMTTQTRNALAGRHSELSSAFTPAGREEIERVTMEMSFSFPSARSISTAEAKITARAYANALVGLPLWAIKNACNMVSRGAVDGLSCDFAPSAPRLREIADSIVTPFHKERTRIRTVLDAREEATVNDEERKRVAAKVIALARDMRMQRASESPKPPNWNPTPADMLMLEHGVSREAWNAIPDAPSRR